MDDRVINGRCKLNNRGRGNNGIPLEVVTAIDSTCECCNLHTWNKIKDRDELESFWNRILRDDNEGY